MIAFQHMKTSFFGTLIALGFFVSAFGARAESTVTVLSPNGGDNWKFDEQRTISWQSNGSDFKGYAIELLNLNKTTIWNILGVTDQSSYSWTVGAANCSGAIGTCPPITAGAYYIRVRAQRTGDQEGSYSVFDDSDVPFSISGSPSAINTIRILSPNGGENFGVGQPILLNWITQPASTVDVWLYLYKDVSGNSTDGIQPLHAELIRGGPPYVWRIPSNFTGTSMRLQMRGTGQQFSISDLSDAPFSIGAAVTATPPVPSPSPSIPATNNATTMQLLLARIQALQAQVNALQHVNASPNVPNSPGANSGDESSPVHACLVLNYNLTYRSRDVATGGDVSALQDFLQVQGHLNSQPTGFFGLLTLEAVKKFQSANGINATGFVGPMTRAKIETLTCSRASIQ